jgi:hypothetical protein
VDDPAIMKLLVVAAVLVLFSLLAAYEYDPNK